MSSAPWAVWGIIVLAIAGVAFRPFAWPEYIWAVAGATILVLARLISPVDALSGVAKGTDVYLFLAGMMLLAEVARLEGLFDWLAAHAAQRANGSATRLFALIFAVGTMVTIFLSNDATAVVLTPAVAAVMRAAKAEKPLPYLFVCAFIANAASFVLPISNPANLVVYASDMPPLLQWMARYELASILAIGATYVVLRWALRESLMQTVSSDIDAPELRSSGKIAACGIAGTALVLLTASAFQMQLGMPTFIAGVVTLVLVLPRSTHGAREVVGDISWEVLPLVAGLFVLVEALEKSGAVTDCAAMLRDLVAYAPMLAPWAAGAIIAMVCDIVNNLPAGLIAHPVLDAAKASDSIRSIALIAVDLGPNLSVTGSLATILWLAALRRDGHHVSGWTFLKLGAMVMPPALLLAIAGALAVNHLVK
ncbi:MAG TPA: arsenic transporter [Candidatus Binataceae bacterium]|nr:arsenic transporter [Candidatus Binataceae bacterium]